MNRRYVRLYDYSYDLVGNRTSMLVNGTEQHAYTYDSIYQLTDVNYPDGWFQGDTASTYDPAGNRSQVDAPPTSYTTNSLNRYTFVGSEAFDYDDNGNLTSDGHSTYTYDAENRLVTATVNGRTIQYTYDAAGRRIRKVADGRTTQYVYDSDEVIAEYDGSGTLLRSFVYGPGIDEPICLRAYDFVIGDFTGDGLVNIEDLRALAGKWLLTEAQSGYDLLYDLNQDGKINNADSDLLAAHWQKTAEPVTVFYYHYDGLGSVVALSDDDGNVVETYVYDVYGQSQPVGPSTGNPYRFTGRHWDPETGLYYYRARYYNPQIGRFLQTDPIGYADGINWYAYCGNNPVVLVDPWGLCWIPYSEQRLNPYMSFMGYLEDVAVGFERAPSAIARTARAAKDSFTRVFVDTGGWARDAASGVWDTVRHPVRNAENLVDQLLSPDPRVMGDAIWGLGTDAAISAVSGRLGGKAPKKTGTIYRVPGEGTPSGRPYIGRHNQPNPAKTRRSPDGRDRTQAEVIDTYDAEDVLQGRTKEQGAIDQHGGIGDLDNKRDEIARRKR